MTAYPPQFQPAPPKKKPFYTRWWFIVLAVIVIAGVAASLSGNKSGDDDVADPAGTSTAGASTPSEGKEPEKEPATPGIGDAVTSGDLSLTVVSVDPPVAELGSSALSTKAQGEFIVVALSVTNTGNKAASFYSGQVLLRVGEKEFEPDSTAPLYLAENSAMLFEEINPGNTLSGKVVFDVPKGTKVETLEFKGELFGSPVVVRIS